MTLLGPVVFLILPVSPASVGARDNDRNCDEVEGSPLRPDFEGKEEAVGFIEACRIPGVVSFALCLFSTESVTYTLLYWLPLYFSACSISRYPLGGPIKTLNIFLSRRFAAIAGEYLSSRAGGEPINCIRWWWGQ